MKQLLLSFFFIVSLTNISCASDLNLHITTDSSTLSRDINIISIDDTTYDTRGISQTLLMFTDNGQVYYSIQSGRNCNYRPGRATIVSSPSNVTIQPNSTCGTLEEIKIK